MKASLFAFLRDFRYRRISQNATVNDLLKEIFRKSIHFCASLVPLFALWNLHFTLISLATVICVYTFCEISRMKGHPIPYISHVTAYAARRRDQGRFVLGPVTMGVGVFFTLLLLPHKAAEIGILSLAFGDGIASLAGKLYGKRTIPFMGGKTFAGSSACFVAVFIATLAVTGDPLKSVWIALVTTVIELIPVKDYDNLFIPLLVGGFAVLLP